MYIWTDCCHLYNSQQSDGRLGKEGMKDTGHKSERNAFKATRVNDFEARANPSVS